MGARMSMLRWMGSAALALAVAGCAATAPAPVMAPGAPGAPGAPALQRVAMLPLENLSGRAEPGEMVTRVFFGALGRTGACEMVEPGDVEAGLSQFRIRTTGMLTSEQAVKLAERLRAAYLMTGAILNCESVRTPEGDVPSVGVSMRLLSGADGRVVWTAMRVRSGEDRETVFNWGRVHSLERLTEQTAEELFRRFRLPAGPDSLPAPGGKP